MKPAKYNQSYLSYSGYQCAEGCRYRYWHTYIANTQPSKPDDRLGSIYGTSVGKLFEQFYVERLWRHGNVKDVLLDRVERIVDDTLEEEQKPRKGRPGGIIVWRPDLYGSRDEVVSDVRAAVPRGLATIRAHRLLGLDAQAELKLDSTIQGRRFGGRADFVMTRASPHDDRVILDGKGSRKRDKYTDQKQLLWYSLLHREQYGRLPDKAAFVYWHYDPPSNIDWCTFTEAEADKLKADVLQVMQEIETKTKALGPLKSPVDLPVIQSVFEPSARIENCRFCPFATTDLCAKGFEVVSKAQEQAKARALKELGN